RAETRGRLPHPDHGGESRCPDRPAAGRPGRAGGPLAAGRTASVARSDMTPRRLVARESLGGPRGVVGARRGSHGWLVYLVSMGLLALFSLFLRGTALNSGPVFNLFGFSSICAIVLGTWRQRVLRLPWALIAAGMAAFVGGDILAYNYHRFFGSDLPFPSV